MDRKVLISACAAFVSLAVMCVTAAPWIVNTPLYTYRMEQASDRMSFLPTSMNTITYTTDERSTLICEVTACYSAQSFDTDLPTCENMTCLTYAVTCSTCSGYTCESPCDTFVDTCEATCEGLTCEGTCSGLTCQTCGDTCDGLTCVQITCVPSTCWGC